MEKGEGAYSKTDEASHFSLGASVQLGAPGQGVMMAVFNISLCPRKRKSHHHPLEAVGWVVLSLAQAPVLSAGPRQVTVPLVHPLARPEACISLG